MCRPVLIQYWNSCRLSRKTAGMINFNFLGYLKHKILCVCLFNMTFKILRWLKVSTGLLSDCCCCLCWWSHLCVWCSFTSAFNERVELFNLPKQTQINSNSISKCNSNIYGINNCIRSMPVLLVSNYIIAAAVYIGSLWQKLQIQRWEVLSASLSPFVFVCIDISHVNLKGLLHNWSLKLEEKAQQ